jgi:mRNA-degrading endonuclease RelE of RelBE toxin-antitoxin system
MSKTLSMKVDYSERADRTLDDLAPELRKAVYKQVKLLERNLRHPSLRAKKYDELIAGGKTTGATALPTPAQA